MLQAVVDDLVRLAALDVGDEADAAGILVERGIVQAMRGRRAGIGGVAEGQMLIGAGLLRRPACDIFSARPSSPAFLVLPRRRNLPPAYPARPQRRNTAAEFPRS